MKPKIVLTAVAQIRTDGGTQSRVALSEDAIADYEAAYATGADMPPVVVFFDGETRSHWLADGFHRVEGAKRASCTRIKAEVRPGTLRDAVLFAVGANALHGLRRTNADKRRAVEILLRDAEWGGRSDRWLADAAQVSDKTVATMRAELRISAVGDRRVGADGRARGARKETEPGGDSHGEAAEPTSDRRADISGQAGRGTDLDHGDERRGDERDSHVGLQRVEDVRGAGPDAGNPAPEEAGQVDPVVAVRLCESLLSQARAVAGELALHKHYADPIKAAIAEALRLLDRATPVGPCRTCEDTDGRRENCAQCLGQGFEVRAQLDSPINPPSSRGKPPGLITRENAGSTPAGGARKPRGLRIELVGDDGSAAPFVPPSDDDYLEPAE